MSTGPDRFDVAQLAADAAEWDELSSHRALDVGGAAAVRWHDLRDELAEAAAPAAAHMAHQAEQIAELRRRLEEERVGRASSRRHLQGQPDWALAEIKRLQAAAGAAPVPDAVLEERARQLSESLDVELEHVRHLEARQQALLATIATLGATAPYPEELAGWEGQRAKMIAEVGTLRSTASNQAVTIRRLRFLTLRMAEIADGLDEDNNHTGDILVARKEANDAAE